jgi:hypothetical protein
LPIVTADHPDSQVMSAALESSRSRTPVAVIVMQEA